VTRKVTVNLYTTLDGYAEWPDYPGSTFAPVEPDLMFQEMWIDQYPEVDTVVFGRESFEGHLNVHSEAARKESDPPYMFEYSRWLDRVQKVVLSRSLKSTNWANTRILSGPLAEVLAQLRKEPGKGIIVDGGPSVVKECIEKGLADDYRMAVWPVIYGRGKPYWAPMTTQRTLRLISAKTLSYGELVLHYEEVR
jgi:dihydrofolate reductase